jgi:CIC family chloride channel protein
VVIATGAATTIGRILIGPNPAFAVADIQFSLAQALGAEDAIAFILLGVLCGVASWAFIRLLVVMEDGFPKLPGNVYTQNMVGMAAIGLMMVALTHLYGHPYVDGVGYGVIQSILDQKMTAAGLLVLLFVLKLLATTISLGCGASGGIFSPSLYLGATLGAAFAAAVAFILPHAGLTIPSAAIVGMAAMVGAGTGGVMTAIVMVFEMTRDYAIIVPVIVADRRDDLHRQAAPSGPSHSQGAAHQSLSRQAGPGHHGASLHRREGRHDAEGSDGRRRQRRHARHRCRTRG